MSNISFPGLGLKFSFSKTAFTVPFLNITVRWYGIILTIGIIAAFFMFYSLAKKKEGIVEDDILNLTLFIVPIAIVGARLVFFFTNFKKGDSLLDIYKIWKGGIAIYGAIIFGSITAIVYCRYKKLHILKTLDSLAPAVMLGQIIGRWGNFANAEAYGYSKGVEKLPWRMTVGKVYIDDIYHPEIEFVHPTFLYESLWNLIGLFIILRAYKKKKSNGQIVMMYLAWYGLGRGLIELLRTDSLRIMGIKIFVVLGLGCFAVFTALLVKMFKNSKKYSGELLEYAQEYGIPEEFPESDNIDEDEALDLSETQEDDFFEDDE